MKFLRDERFDMIALVVVLIGIGLMGCRSLTSRFSRGRQESWEG